MNFTVGLDNFEEVESIFGKSSRWHSGDAGTSEDKICYTASSDSVTVTVVFAGDSELSSGFIDEFRLIAGDVDFRDNCAEVDIDPQAMRTSNGIHLGMTPEELKAILGEPSGAGDGMLLYVWQERMQAAPTEEQDSFCAGEDGKSSAVRGSGVKTRFMDGMLQWVEIGRASAFVC